MKAIVPTAGQGTYPYTHTKPKPVIQLAGRPIIGHILDRFADTQVDEVIIVIGGPMKNQVVEYAQTAFGNAFEVTFVEHPPAEGLGHAIYQATPEVDGDPVIIALVNMFFENNYDTFLNDERSAVVEGRIGVKSVAEPQHYGVVDIDGEVLVRSLVEKPADPPSGLAISGVFIMYESDGLLKALDDLIATGQRGAGNEYQLTDALQVMLANGSQLETFEIEDWYDCGRPETLLEANCICLAQVDADTACARNQAVIIEDDVTIIDAIVQDSINGRDSRLANINIDSSIVRDNATVVGNCKQLNVGDNSVVGNV